MIIFGIHFGHDSSLSVIKNGKIVASVEEERFTRIKVYKGFPYGGLEYVEQEFGLKLSDADLVVFSGERLFENYTHEAFKERILPREGKKNIYSSTLKKLLENKKTSSEKNREFFYEFMRDLGVDRDRILFVGHHMSHAASAFYQSPFHGGEALIVTSDGKGDDVSSEIYIGKNGKLEKLTEISALSSIGQMYSAVTGYLGFKPNRHEGKITGLASYGDPKKFGDRLLSLFQFDDHEGRYRSIFEKRAYSDDTVSILQECPAKDRIRINSLIPYRIDKMYEGISCAFHNELSTIFKGAKREDVAAAAQYALEKTVVRFVKYWVQKTGQRYVCMAGGVFANVKLNQRILEIEEVDNLFVQPAMGDSGLSLGGALLGMVRKDTTFNGHTIHDVYKGPEFSDDIIESKLKKTDFHYRKMLHSDLAIHAAKLLTEKKIIGFFNGRMEYGPRALGSRSILISPSDKTINQTVNTRLNRTEFMPFAPVVMDRYAKDYFIEYEENHIAAEFMTITYDVYEDKIDSIQAVVHVDGTARPQVIKREKKPLYYDIISEFYNLTGIPVLVNTSFNAHEEPILMNVDNAINALKNDIVDYLLIGSFLVSK